MATNGSQNIVTAATGTVLQGAGVGVAPTYSTATYPATATGTGTILRANGTNWVASTATYPDTAGSSSNVLTSNGTNWSSSAPSAGSSYYQCINTYTGNPLDGITYYFSPGTQFTNSSTVTGLEKFMTPIACTLTKFRGVFTVAGTLGSSQNCTLFIRVNNSSNTDVSTTIQLTSSSVTVTNTGLSISLSAGDYISFGFTGPTWTTNPTVVSFCGGVST